MLGEEHEGIRITIDGTLTWSGPANEDKGMIKIQFTSNVVIDGSGLLDSVYDASGAIETPGDCFETIAWGVDIYVSQNITVSGTSASSPLKFRNLTGMVQAESAGAVQCSNRSCDITTKHLDGEEMSRYGVYWNADGVWIENCHVHRPINDPEGGTCYHERGFRGYGDDVTIRDCSAYHMVSNKGTWYLAGNVDPQGGTSLIDGYRSDHYLWIGPNSACDWETAGLANLTVRNLDVADITMELGSRNINIINLSTEAE